jgi:glycosyltransferase involved in cell wall biosynthesis
MHLNDDSPRYNRFSFPCKFTSALAAGLPLICLGHHESSLVELAKNYGLGILLTDADRDTMTDRLAEKLADFSRFPGYRKEIARCAETEFNAERERQKLHQLMNEAANGV